MRERGFGARHGLLRLICSLETQVLIDDPWHIFIGHFHIPQTFRPDHCVRAEGANIQAAAPDYTDFAFEVSFFRNFSQLLHHFFRTVVAAGFAFAIAVVDADVKLPSIRLLRFDYVNSLGTIDLTKFYSRKIFRLHAGRGYDHRSGCALHVNSV